MALELLIEDVKDVGYFCIDLNKKLRERGYWFDYNSRRGTKFIDDGLINLKLTLLRNKRLEEEGGKEEAQAIVKNMVRVYWVGEIVYFREFETGDSATYGLDLDIFLEKV